MKEFKTESKRILDLMVNSIYTNKEIFLRELISNASDAIDKRHFISLTDTNAAADFKIEITPDKTARTLTISDNGIGMTAEELENNLGVIANSGTLAFKQKEKDKLGELIGQFGVGFYSAFMVADKVEVLSRAYGSDKANLWVSTGAEGYEISEAQKEEPGTVITLYLKAKDEDFDYGELLEEHYLKTLIKKYSDYIRYPITMEVTKSRKKEGGKEDEYEDYKETETLNSMVPVWKKNKKDIDEKAYADFYKGKFYDYEDPLRVIHTNIEGSVNYTALLFVPARAPYNYYSKEFKKGLQLYTNGVLITDKCEALLPDCYAFMRGIVDSADVSLNISREMLQEDRQLKAISGSLEKKITSELKKFMEEDREKYEKFFKELGLSLKFGVYNNFGLKKDELKDLLLFYSSTRKKLITLKEYTEGLKEGQDAIYYACGESVEKLDSSPKTELLREKGFEVLYLTDDIDEFVFKTLDEYEGKKFKSASGKDLGLESEEEKKAQKDLEDKNKELFDFIKEALGGKVKEVRLSSRLKDNAVCVTADGEVSLEMERVFKAMNNKGGMPVVAEKVLEINGSHKMLEKLRSLYENDKDTLTKYAKILFDGALMAEGLMPDDLNEYNSLVSDTLSK